MLSHSRSKELQNKSLLTLGRDRRTDPVLSRYGPASEPALTCQSDFSFSLYYCTEGQLQASHMGCLDICGHTLKRFFSCYQVLWLPLRFTPSLYQTSPCKAVACEMLRNQAKCSFYEAMPSLKIPLLLLRGQRDINLGAGYVSLG